MNLDKDIDKLNVNLTNTSTNLIKNKTALSNQLETIISTNLNNKNGKYTPKLDPYKKTRLLAWSKNIELEKKNERTAQNTDKDKLKLKLMINLFMNMIYRQKEIIKDEKYMTRFYRRITTKTNQNYEKYYLTSRLRQLLPIGYSHKLNISKLGWAHDILYILSWTPVQLHLCKFAVGLAAYSFMNLYCFAVCLYIVASFVYEHRDIYSLMPFVLRRTRYDFSNNIRKYLGNSTRTNSSENIPYTRSTAIHVGGKKKVHKNVVKVSKVKKTIKKSIIKKVNK